VILDRVSASAGEGTTDQTGLETVIDRCAKANAVSAIDAKKLD
jgi:hypothetical protein